MKGRSFLRKNVDRIQKYLSLARRQIRLLIQTKLLNEFFQSLTFMEISMYKATRKLIQVRQQFAKYLITKVEQV